MGMMSERQISQRCWLEPPLQVRAHFEFGLDGTFESCRGGTLVLAVQAGLRGLPAAAYDHSASTRILPAFTAASRRRRLSSGAKAFRPFSWKFSGRFRASISLGSRYQGSGCSTQDTAAFSAIHWVRTASPRRKRLPLARPDAAQGEAQLITEKHAQRLAQRGAVGTGIAGAEVVPDAFAQILRDVRFAVCPWRPGADTDVEQCPAVALFTAGDIDTARDIPEPPAVRARRTGHRARVGEHLGTCIPLSSKEIHDRVGAALLGHRLSHIAQRSRGCTDVVHCRAVTVRHHHEGHRPRLPRHISTGAEGDVHVVHLMSL